jgi:hypothetical protein
MADINQIIDTLSDEELELLNSDPEMLAAFKAKYSTEPSRNPAPPPTSAMVSPMAALGEATQRGFDAAGEKIATTLSGGIGLERTALPPPFNVLPKVDPTGFKTPPEVAAAIGTGVQMAPDIAMATMGGATNAAKGVKASGPFTAGLKDPSSVLPGSLSRAGDALGVAKTAARTGESAAEASRLRSLLLKGKQGVVKVAEEGKKAIEAGKDADVTQLLAYREGLGKAQAMGGGFANDYKKAFDKATELLKAKAPDLVAAMEKYNVAALAKEGPEFTAPFLETAINPGVGAVKAGYKALQLAPVRNAMGAAANMAMRTAPAGANELIRAYDKVFNKKKRKKE